MAAHLAIAAAARGADGALEAEEAGASGVRVRRAEHPDRTTVSATAMATPRTAPVKRAE